MSIHREACLLRDTSQNEVHIKDEATRKRTRDDSEAACAIDTRPFSIRSDSANPFARPRIFKPQCLLDRSRLPLAYLDTAQDGSRLFAAHVQILEACHEYKDDGKVLIVEDDDERRLYAVERVQRRQYALCRLGCNVRKDDMLKRSESDVRPHEPQKKRQARQSVDAGKPWWMSASVDMSTSRETWAGHKPKLSLHAAAEGRPVSAGVVHVVEQHVELALPSVGEDLPEDVTIPKPASPEDALEELARQYLDALYLSRTPLAYFVKGPLARARANFSAQPAELIGFLRSSILLAPVADKKYRESVSEIVREMSLLDTPDTKPKTRRKRKWKPKRDKHGLWSEEKDYVEQWWRKDDGSSNPSSSVESLQVRLQRRLQRLRNRETFLQVILILETMALEASTPPTLVAPLNLESQSNESQAQESQAVPNAKSKKKKEADMAGLLETLIDRLRIWYSLESSSPLKAGGENGTAAQDEVKDDLKNFAVEVVIPFWSSRIFDQANAASKKLGGPAAPSPIKRKSSSAPRRPGEPAIRQAPEKKPRRPLERASTDTLNRKRPPSLHRAATDQDALAPLIKREQSEQPQLKHIPPAKSKSQSRSKHTSLLDQAMGSKRQVDFSAMSQASDAKLREKAKRELLVQEAVKGIRKPNRSLATEETARKADESFARELAKKKSIKSQPQRSTAAPITATPAPRRRTHAGSNDRSGATSIVPSSTTKLFARAGDAVGSTPAVPQTGHRPRHTLGVEETPSRGFAKFMPAGLAREPGTLLESPSASRTALVAATPARPLKLTATPMRQPSAFSVTARDRLQAIVEASPRELDRIDDSGIGLSDTGTTAERSIYADLGWENYDDYEPLQ